MNKLARITVATLFISAGMVSAADKNSIPGWPKLDSIPFIQDLIRLVPGLGEALNTGPQVPDNPDWLTLALPTASQIAPIPALPDDQPFTPPALPSLASVMQDAKNDPNPPKTPKYERSNIYDTTSLQPVPYATFINVANFEGNKECKAKDPKATNCNKYSYKVPYSLDTATVQVGQNLRTAWQRLEDRMYWRAMTSLNNPMMLASHCIIDWGQNAPATAPNITINVMPGMYPSELNGKIKQQPVDDNLQMDRYSILPNVPNSDYCAGLDPDFTLMYLPGTCVYAPSGTKLFCIEGDQQTLNPLAPKPIDFQYGQALKRVADAIKTTEKEYQEEYYQDVLKALKPTAKFLPTLWDNMFTGAVIAPTTTIKPNVMGLLKQAKDAGQQLGGVFKNTAPVYYLQGVTSNSVTQPLLVHQLPNRNDVLGVPNPPGVWPLEEAKRTFNIQPVPVADRFGFTSVFSSWTRPELKLLPEDPQGKVMRQMIYGAIGNNVYLPVPFPVPVPAPVLLKEFIAGLPYVGLQTRFTWHTIPEGYDVPNVNGSPMMDYPLGGK